LLLIYLLKFSSLDCDNVASSRPITLFIFLSKWESILPSSELALQFFSSPYFTGLVNIGLHQNFNMKSTMSVLTLCCFILLSFVYTEVNKRLQILLHSSL